jgi:hypothetical protein
VTPKTFSALPPTKIRFIEPMEHLDSKRENISIRAAEDIIEFTQKAVEHEKLEKRIEALEARLSQPEGNYR